MSKRGRFVKKSNHEKRRKVEEQIAKRLEKDYDKLRRPMHAFITFEHQDGVNKALNLAHLNI